MLAATGCARSEADGNPPGEARRLISVTKTLCAIACLLIVAGCSSGKGTTAAHGPTTSTRSTSTTTAPQPRLSARIELRSGSIVAGSSESGDLVIENHGAPLRLQPPGTTGCTPLWSIVLANQTLPQTAVFATGCDGLPAVLRAGETRLPFTLRSTFQSCSSTGLPQGALTPACLRDAQGASNVAPPLPVGLYHATFFTNDASPFVKVASLPVRIVSAARP
jgi:hypothetical protein